MLEYGQMVLQCLMPMMARVFLVGLEMRIILNHLHLMHAKAIHVKNYTKKLNELIKLN